MTSNVINLQDRLPYWKGRRDYETVGSIYDNPYPKGTSQYRAWIAGWRDEDDIRQGAGLPVEF